MPRCMTVVRNAKFSKSDAYKPLGEREPEERDCGEPGSHVLITRKGSHMSVTQVMCFKHAEIARKRGYIVREIDI